MASGLQAFADLAASTNTTLYTVPTSKTLSFAVNFANRNEVPIVVTLSISDAATPANGEYIFYQLVIEGNNNFERTGLVAQAGKLIVVQSSNANVSAQVYGYEV